MKTPACFAAAAFLLACAGCQSNYDHRAGGFPEQLPALQPVYTVVIIPNERLTPTSREGDSGPVYSSNIVGVFLNGAGGTNSAATNSDNENGAE